MGPHTWYRPPPPHSIIPYSLLLRPHYFPAVAIILSIHLFLGRPLFLLHLGSSHIVAFKVHLLSLYLARCAAQRHYYVKAHLRASIPLPFSVCAGFFYTSIKASWSTVSRPTLVTVTLDNPDV